MNNKDIKVMSEKELENVAGGGWSLFGFDLSSLFKFNNGLSEPKKQKGGITRPKEGGGLDKKTGS